MPSYQVKISGMTCASCAASIEKQVSKIEHVQNVRVNYATHTGRFDFSEGLDTETIDRAIEQLGFKVNGESDQAADQSSGFNLFVISMSLALCIFFLAMWPLQGWPNQSLNWWLQLVLCAPIWGWVGWKFQKSLWTFFTTGRSSMNTLIGLGTTSAFTYSGFVVIFSDLSIKMGLSQIVYFEAVGFIISFVYLGQYFEDKAKKKTTEAMRSLFQLSSKEAHVIIDGKVETVAITKIERGQIIRVKPGEKFPVDGTVIKGNSNVDESMITGEPLPVLKQAKSDVFAGTMNGEGVIDFRSTKVGRDTFLSQIITFVEDAQISKPKIQKVADRISGVFTPVVMILALITFLCWFFLGPEPKWGYAISNFIAVLVIACPCALGLATPTAVVVATGRASLKGLLIGGGEVLEKSHKIDAVIFDKTGTITEGKPKVIALVGNESEKWLPDVACIEQFSEHPISKAIVKEAARRHFDLNDEPDDFSAVVGKGIVAEIQGKDYVIGTKSLLIESGVAIKENLITDVIGTLVYVACNKEHVGSIVIGDQLKEGAAEAIKRLHDLGIETWMITGDHELAAKQIAASLPIDHVIADAMPLTKAEYIVKLQEEGKKVAMIGDGINDAPALAKANLSIAMGTGTDVAMNASDVTIVKGDLDKVADMILLSRHTIRIMKQNLFLSLVYNSLLIPLAAGVLYLFDGPMMPPVLASVAMGLSSISVVSNSLRIRRFI